QPDPAHLAEPPSLDDELAALRRARAGRVLTSYTRIRRAAVLGSRAFAPAEEARAEEATPAIVPEPLADEDALDVLPGGRGTGIFLHRLLEEIDPGTVRAARDAATWSETPAVRELARRIAAEEGLPATALDAG